MFQLADWSYQFSWFHCPVIKVGLPGILSTETSLLNTHCSSTPTWRIMIAGQSNARKAVQDTQMFSHLLQERKDYDQHNLLCILFHFI